MKDSNLKPLRAYILAGLKYAKLNGISKSDVAKVVREETAKVWRKKK